MAINDLTNKDVFDEIQLDVRRENQQKFGFRVSEKDGGLVRVTSVAMNAPTTGLLLPGDYIVRINGHKVKNRENLFHYANKAKSKVTLVIARLKMSSISTSSSSTNKSPSSSDAAMVKKAASFGYKIKENKEYLLIRIKRKRNKRLALRVRRKGNKVIVTKIENDSYAENLLKIGDYLLAINDRKVTDRKICHDLIKEFNGEFEALVERTIPEEDDSDIANRPLKCSYVPPNLNVYEQQLGSPYFNYETAPEDVQNILNKRIPVITQNFIAPLKNSKNDNLKVTKATERVVNIANDVVLTDIPSEVHPARILKKPSSSPVSNPFFDPFNF